METVSKRLNVVNELNSFANDAESFLKNFIQKLGWTVDGLMGADLVACPISASHSVPSSYLAKHVESCSSKTGQQALREDTHLPSSNFFYTKSTSVVPVLIDKNIQHEILSSASSRNPFEKNLRTEVMDVPPTVDRCVTDLTREERSAIYEYVVKKSKATNKPMPVSLDDLQFSFETKQDTVPEAKTQLELLAEMRDYKRRRQSYRAKNVHITKKSYTEVLREVIANQSTFLEHSPSNAKNESRSTHENESETIEISGRERKRERRERYSSDSSSERQSSHSKEKKHRSHKDYKHKWSREHHSKKKHSRF